ncbi:MAG: hypothetical protein ABSG98_11710 [Anaerolineales bacterium]
MQVGTDTAAGRLDGPYRGKGCLVDRGGGAILLQPLAEELHGTQVAPERVASELAIQRLTGEVSNLRALLALWDAAHPKPKAPGWITVATTPSWASAIIAGEIQLREPALGLWGCFGIFLVLALIGTVVLALSNKVRMADWQKQSATGRDPLVRAIKVRETEIATHRLIVTGQR